MFSEPTHGPDWVQVLEESGTGNARATSNLMRKHGLKTRSIALGRQVLDVGFVRLTAVTGRGTPDQVESFVSSVR